MRRRGASSIAANPVLIGAATTLVVIVAVFLAYNANSGLPFVPTYQINVNVPSGANLVKGNEVRVGGSRVGTVTDITPRRGRDGRFYAQLQLKLQTTVKPLPMDSSVLVRPRSALGLKFVEITKGNSSKGFAEGATVPLRNARPLPVEIDEVFNTFDEKTRAASQANLFEFGNALAGRGADLNSAIEELNPLLTNLVPVARALSSNDTKLARFFQSLGRAARITAPVAETQGQLFVDLDRTFSALSDVRTDLQDTISGAPQALEVGTRALPFQRRFLANTQGLFRDLRPGVRALRTAAPDIADALVVGTPTLKRSIALNKRLKPLFASLVRFGDDPLVKLGIRDLRNTASILAPTISNLRPAQTVCNYVTLWFRNIASLLSEGDRNGTFQRFIIIGTPQGPNNEGGPSSKPADGPSADNHTHVDPYPNTASPGQPNECEAANETYDEGRTVIGNDPGTQQLPTERTTRSLTK